MNQEPPQSNPPRDTQGKLVMFCLECGYSDEKCEWDARCEGNEVITACPDCGVVIDQRPKSFNAPQFRRVLTDRL